MNIRRLQSLGTEFERLANDSQFIFSGDLNRNSPSKNQKLQDLLEEIVPQMRELLKVLRK